MTAARKTAKDPLRFADMPRDFEALCRLLPPRPIHDKQDYANVSETADAMAAHEENFTPDQEDYFNLLCLLIESYDAQHAEWPKTTPLEMLKHLLQEHNMTASDLSRLLGTSRTLGPMILRGERSITIEHARKLSVHFGLHASAFVV